MKKLFTGLLLFLSILVLYNFIDSSSLENNEMSIRNVYLENEYDVTSLIEKYDICNKEKDIIEINETYYEEIKTVSCSNLYEIEYNLLVDKNNSCFNFSYVLYKNNLEYLTSSVIIDVVVSDEDIYLFSNNGYYTTLDNLSNKVENCAYALVANSDACLGISYAMNIDGGLCGGSMSSTAGALATAAVVGMVCGSSYVESAQDSTFIPPNKGYSQNENNKTFDDVLKGNSVWQGLTSLQKQQVLELLAIMLGLEKIENLHKFYDSDNKVLCIGRDISERFVERNDGYQNYAFKYGFWAFFNVAYLTFVAKFTQLIMDIANELLIHYCCLTDWDFILVTNPYYYINGRFKGLFGGYGYKKELELIRSYNYNYFENGLTWDTIPNSGVEELEASHFVFSDFRVSKGFSKGVLA